ncbi:MAG: phage holin, LLH family [Atribacterota bacterium]
MLEAILSKYLLNALLLSLVSIFYSFLKNKLGEDRASTIKEAILSAMLWAEEELGIGNGSQKWEIAWKKLIEILADKNIKLRKSEEKVVKTMMEANVGKINKQTYDILSKRKLLKDKGPSQQSLLTK